MDEFQKSNEPTNLNTINNSVNHSSHNSSRCNSVIQDQETVDVDHVNRLNNTNLLGNTNLMDIDGGGCKEEDNDATMSDSKSHTKSKGTDTNQIQTQMQSSNLSGPQTSSPSLINQDIKEIDTATIAPITSFQQVTNGNANLVIPPNNTTIAKKNSLEVQTEKEKEKDKEKEKEKEKEKGNAPNSNDSNHLSITNQ